MKRRFLILWLITCISVSSIGCSNDDEVFYKKNSLNGTWNLASYGGGFSGQFTEYKNRAVTWTFDTITSTVFIRSKLDYFGPKIGRYPYEIRKDAQDDKNNVLYLNDSVQGIMYLNEDELLLNHGLIATFKR